MSAPLYVDTSAALRALLETGTTPAFERRLAAAPLLVCSRLALVESSRAIHRLRSEARVPERALADAERELDALWARCEIWELGPSVCDLAGRIAPARPLRTLDALHLATLALARKRIPDLELLTADERLAESAGSE